ncbi:LAME_0E09032g1_1 [Lachancea meyersii CBS 8951]|uniref:LAME_0E09032g1_1 n=1 Tax=Lachancea meyersii CBS 8951 TaxID=1266667 RepID=A0A1G4JJB9_9SACH|nr:LAME_0E09032g1_1 [Lachancea meyersii CBS 8951]
MVKQELGAFFGPRRLYFVCGKVYKDLSYANKVVHWFVQHKLPVMPVTPTGGQVDLTTDSFTQTVTELPKLSVFESIAAGLSQYPAKKAIDGISVCFVTPPPITLSILEQLQTAPFSVQSVWFQPGSWDLKCIECAEQKLHIDKSKVINDCVLVKGDSYFAKSELPLNSS